MCNTGSEVLQVRVIWHKMILSLSYRYHLKFIVALLPTGFVDWVLVYEVLIPVLFFKIVFSQFKKSIYTTANVFPLGYKQLESTKRKVICHLQILYLKTNPHCCVTKPMLKQTNIFKYSKI